MKGVAILGAVAALCAGAAQAEVVLACTFTSLPPVAFHYPDDPASGATLVVDGRPAQPLTVGQGTNRVEHGVVDGYDFQFTPASLSLHVIRGDVDIATETGKCVTLGGAANVTPLSLVPGPVAEVEPAPAPEDRGKWLISEDKSQLDDSSTVFLSLNSENMVAGQFGSAGPATLMIRCKENTTSIFMTLNDQFLADIQGYGTVSFRIDDGKAGKLRMDASTDNKALGLWAGGAAIPFATKLIKGKRVIFRVTPFNESPQEVTFDLTGLPAVIEPLRKACKW